MTDRYLTIGVFARRAGISVRTLQYYDRINLLKPSAYSEGGRRLYHERDFARLQQIMTLKFIGLSLDDIQTVLTHPGDLQQMLTRQKHALVQKVQQIRQIIGVIEAAQQVGSVQSLVEIIQEINMSNETDWLGQFLTPEQQKRLAGQDQTLAEQKRIALEIRQLIEDADHSAARWEGFIRQYAQGDESLQAGIRAAYANIASMPGIEDAAVRQWLSMIERALQ